MEDHVVIGGIVIQRIRVLLLVEGAAFVGAALVHFGVLVRGYEHSGARIPESVIGLVLFAGLAVSRLRPVWTREAGIAAQGFALAGTLVGLFTIAVGVGPRTVPDIVYHIGIITVLVWGLSVTARMPPASTLRTHPDAS
jgi:hypothetical protein